MHMSDFLQAENVLVGLNASSKNQLLRQLSDITTEKTSVISKTVSKALTDRESLGSTGIGNGIALPHAAIPGLDRVFCLVARLAKPIDFEAVDDVPVDIVVLLLTPVTARSDALNVLSCVARRFRDEETVRGVRAARTSDEVFTLLAG